MRFVHWRRLTEVHWKALRRCCDATTGRAQVEDDVAGPLVALGWLREDGYGYAPTGAGARALKARGELDEALRIRREEQLPVYEKLGDVRELLVGRANLAITLHRWGRPADRPEMKSLLELALAEAERLGLPEADQIRDLMRSLSLS